MQMWRNSSEQTSSLMADQKRHLGFQDPTCGVKCPDSSFLTPSLCSICLLLETLTSLGFCNPHFLLVCCLLSKCSFWVHVSPSSSHSWPFSCHLLLPLSSLSTPFVRRDFIYSHGFVINKRMISKHLGLS